MAIIWIGKIFSVWFITRNYHLPKKHHYSSPKCLEVNMSIVLGLQVEVYISKKLHSNNGVNEKEHSNEKQDIGQGLKPNMSCTAHRLLLFSSNFLFSSSNLSSNLLHTLLHIHPKFFSYFSPVFPNLLNYIHIIFPFQFFLVFFPSFSSSSHPPFSLNFPPILDSVAATTSSSYFSSSPIIYPLLLVLNFCPICHR